MRHDAQQHIFVDKWSGINRDNHLTAKKNGGTPKKIDTGYLSAHKTLI